MHFLLSNFYNITKINAKNKVLTDSWDISKESNTYKSYYNVFGSSDEWSLHEGYYDYIVENIENDMQHFFDKGGG